MHTEYTLFEINWDSGGMTNQVITEQEFEAMLRSHNPAGADQTLRITKSSRGQYFFSSPGDKVDKRVIYRQVQS